MPGVGGEKRKALFLDRDGVINEDSGYPFLPGHIRFRKGIFDFCRRVLRKGYVIVVVTNQAGVARGLFDEAAVQALHEWMGERFRREGVEVAGFYYCPYHKDATVARYRHDSPYRKPKPGMVLQAAEELELDLDRSVMVGDKHSDRIELPGFRSMILKSRYTGEDYDLEQLHEVLGHL